MKTLIIALALVSSGVAKETKSTQAHRIYIEPDISVTNSQTYRGEDFKVRYGSQQFGVNIGYEHFKGNSIYAAASAQSSLGSQQGELTINNGDILQSQLKTVGRGTKGHLGYTFETGHFSFSPYSGFGGYYWGVEKSHKTSTLYLPIGMRIEYNMPAQNLSLGLKCEMIKYVYYWSKLEDHSEAGLVSVLDSGGYEISAPLSFREEEAPNRWYASIEPYVLKLFNDLYFFGGRFAANRQF